MHKSGFADMYAGETRQYQLSALNGALDYQSAFARRDAALLDSFEKRLEVASVTPDMSAASIREQLRQTRHLKEAVAGRPDSAIVMFQRWCRLDLTDAQSAMSEGARSSGETACENAAELLAEQGRFAEAVSAYEDGLKFVPGHWIARLGRARALVCLGDKPRARAAYAELLVQWNHADSDLPDLAEVKSGAAGLASLGSQLQAM